MFGEWRLRNFNCGSGSWSELKTKQIASFSQKGLKNHTEVQKRGWSTVRTTALLQWITTVIEC